MQFNPLGFALTAAMTRDLPESRRAQVNLLGGMMGPSPVGAVLLGVAARQGGLQAPTEGTVSLPGGGASPPEEVEVPELFEEDPELTAEAIKARELVPETVEVVSDEPVGKPIGIRPQPGSVVPVGTHVAVLVSKGLKVPDVRGKNLEEATSILSGAGFEVEKKVQREKVRSVEKVENQDPPGGKFAGRDKPVVLTVPALAKSAAEE
ncbi:MAG: PASTA domain-containing protein [Methanosarcina sp.]